MMPILNAKSIFLSLYALQRQERHPSTFFASGFSPSPSLHFHDVHHQACSRRIPSPYSSSIGLARGNSNYYNPKRDEKPSNIRYDDGDDGDDGDDYYDYEFDDDGMMEDEQYFTQQQRLASNIDCPHFGTCPGCVRDTNVAEIDVIESAKLFFSSSSIQKHILHDNNRYSNYDDYDDEEGFYKIKIPSPVTQWRTQAKLAVSAASTWSRAAGCKIGLYKRHSHEVLSIPDCQVHHPSINKAVDVLTKATQTVRTPAYQEDTGEGLLRYVQCQVELSTGKVCLSLVMNAERFKDCQPHLSYLVKELKRNGNAKLWHSIWCHCNDSKGNAIFARDVSRWHPVDGPPYVRESIPGSDPDKREGLLYFSPYVFRQGNLEGFGEISKQVREAIPRGSKVCELYAGVGLLGLSALLHHGKQQAAEEDGVQGLGWLRCSDENPENARCFERAVNSMSMHITGRTPKKFQNNGKKGSRRKQGRKQKSRPGDNGEMSIKDLMDSMVSENDGSARPPQNDPSERVTYMQANAASALHRGEALGANVLIVDPPRRGLDEAVLQQLCLPRNSKQPYAEKASMVSHLPRHTVNWTNDVRTLIYVSCGFDALARDLDQLLTSSSSGWKLESATGYVLFPGSNHVETVVVIRR
mmetsp:Transcript_37161/g.77825  ORF Transcript_37161/g.77825 Transcript_37161/m.77825 type:complete len:638 (+) Transcript_37161:130-2043(+)